MATIAGTANSDYVHPNDGSIIPGDNDLPLATAGADVFNGGQGGNDTLVLGAGADIANFGSDFDGNDSVDGGSGAPNEFDELVLAGATFANLGANSMFDIETIRFLGFDVPANTLATHHLTLHDANVGASDTIFVVADTLPDYIALEFDYSADTDAYSFVVSGGAADDYIKGRGVANGFFDRIDLTKGGADTVICAGTMDFGATYDGQDNVDGLFNGRVRLYGDYSTQLTLTNAMMKNLGSFYVGQEGGGGTGYDYSFKLLADSVSPQKAGIGFVAQGLAGTQLTVDATALPSDKSVSLIGGASNDTLYGGAGGEYVQTFGDGADVFYGNDGGDQIFSTAGLGPNDILDGGAGYDRLYLQDTPGIALAYDGISLAGIEVFAGFGPSVSLTLVVSDAAISSPEAMVVDWTQVTSTAGVLQVDASAETDTALRLWGGAANDLLIGGARNDEFRGGGGVDELWGNAGNDLYIDPAGDVIHEADGGGIDTVQSAASFSLASAAFVERLILTGGAAVNGVGSTRGDNITGNNAANILNGGGGADTLYGRGGADTLNGGQGDDTYINPDSLDTIVEAAGVAGGLHDRIQSDTSISLASVSNIEDATLTGTAAVNINGNNGANTLFGNSAANIINGGGGKDTIFGAGGDDRMDGGQGADLFSFAATGNGTDRIFNFETALDRFVLTGNFTARIESNGDTTLFYGGGKIIIQDITGLSLVQWNARVTSPDRTAGEAHHMTVPPSHDDSMAAHAARAVHIGDWLA